MTQVPDSVIERFRELSLDRLSRVESTWLALAQGMASEEAAAEMHREIHTIKGDARLTGFHDINLLCQKLEDLFALGASIDYQVPDEVDLLVTMAVQFTGMLLRRTDGTRMGGIDLEGFVGEVDRVLSAIREPPEDTASSPRRARRARGRAQTVDRVSTETRSRLAAAAGTAFVEHLNARGHSRERLRELWHSLQREIQRLEEVPLAPLLDRHLAGATDLALSLGKRVYVTLDVGGTRVPAAAAESIDTAALHLVRNAIDHGIEPSPGRREAGKSETGSIHISARARRDTLHIWVEDDGRGVDLDAIRERGLARGLLLPWEADQAAEADLLRLIFRHGFSTREQVNDVSGRGVGLDTVKAELERLGGGVSLSRPPGGGSAFELWLPRAMRHIRVSTFVAPDVGARFAVPSEWQYDDIEVDPDDAVHPAALVGLRARARQTGVVPRKQRALAFRWGTRRVTFLAASDAQLATADRICPTSEDDAFEVVSIEGREALLLRPQHVGRGGRTPSSTSALPDG